MRAMIRATEGGNYKTQLEASHWEEAYRHTTGAWVTSVFIEMAFVSLKWLSLRNLVDGRRQLERFICDNPPCRVLAESGL